MSDNRSNQGFTYRRPGAMRHWFSDDFIDRPETLGDHTLKRNMDDRQMQHLTKTVDDAPVIVSWRGGVLSTKSIHFVNNIFT